MARAKTSKASIERAQRQEKVLNLRLAGASIREISNATGIPKSTVQKLAADAITEIKREPAEQVVDMELQRLDRLLRSIWPAALDGDVKAIDRALRIMERRAKYMNLDAAVAPDTSGESKQALEDLMTAIENSVDDSPELALSAMAPGATIESVLGPQDEPEGGQQ